MGALIFKPEALIQQLQSLQPHLKRIFIGVSGGLDSMVLAHALRAYPGVEWVHVQHHLQAVAEEWVAFVTQQALAHQVPLHVHHVGKAPAKGESIEAFARAERYAFFQSILTENTDVLLLAHHQDDQVETFLLNLLRGSGIEGLSAMPTQRFLGMGQLLRPLLAYSRQALLDYAIAHDLAYVTDPSNADITFDRNYLREQVLPMLKKRWPDAPTKITQAVEHLQKTRKCLTPYLEAELEAILHPISAVDPAWVQRWIHSRLNQNKLREKPQALQHTLLHFWIKSVTGLILHQAHLERLEVDFLQAREGAAPCFAFHGWEIRAYRGEFYVLKALPPRPPHVPSMRLICHPEGRAHSNTLGHCLQEAGVPGWLRPHLEYVFEKGALRAVTGVWRCQ